MAAILLLVLVGGDLLSSVALRGLSASAPQSASKVADQRDAAPMGESAAGARAPAAIVTADALKQASQPTESAKPASAPVATPADGDSAQDTASPPTTEARSRPGASLPVLRIFEVGLAVLAVAFATAGFLMGRLRRWWQKE